MDFSRVTARVFDNIHTTCIRACDGPPRAKAPGVTDEPDTGGPQDAATQDGNEAPR